MLTPDARTRNADENDIVLLSGIKPGREIHLGHYFGGIHDIIKLQHQYRCHLLIADYHAITRPDLVDDIERRSIEIAAMYLASGIDPRLCTIYRQSDAPEVFEILWLLTSISPMGRLHHAPVYKAYSQQGTPCDAGILMYPVLMAADIALVRAKRVLVGQDQASHIELARDLIKKLDHLLVNKLREPLPVCEAQLSKHNMVLGLDGEKMSRKYDNTISMLATREDVAQRVRKIVTDSRSVDEPGDPHGTVLSLHELVSSELEHKKLSDSVKRGAQWGLAKDALAQKLYNFLEPIQTQYHELRKNDDDIRDTLREGASAVRAGAKPLLEDLRSAFGIGTTK